MEEKRIAYKGFDKDKKPLTFCIDWMRGRAGHTPMPASRATMESIVDWLEELESLKTPDPQADRPRTNGDVIRAMSDEGLVKLLVRKAKPWCAGLRCKEDYDCRTCIDRWLKREAP